MKVFLQPYFKKNFGDDLFISIILDRYNEEFFSYGMKEYEEIFHNKLKVYNGKIYKIINTFFKIVTLKKIGIVEIFSKLANISVLIGGSMFIENKNKKAIFSLSKPYYIIGANFGPYKTEQYYNKFYNVFKNAEDVCFREKYSKELFKDLENIRVKPDIVFSLNTKNIKITNNKKVVISVIDCERKISIKYKEKYEQKIQDIIRYFISKEYEIVLMSYCKAEYDERAINSILGKIEDKNVLSKISTYFYDGNINEALDVMGDSQIIIGSRFHANIIGMVLGKTVIPIAYSDKTLNVLNDIQFEGKVMDIREIDKFNLTDKDLEYKIDITKLKKEAEKHFEKLDKILKRREKDE